MLFHSTLYTVLFAVAVVVVVAVAALLAYKIACRRETFDELQVPLIHDFPLRPDPVPDPPQTVGWAIQEREARRNKHMEKKLLASSKAARRSKREVEALESRTGLSSLASDDSVILDARLYLRGLPAFSLAAYLPDMGRRLGKLSFMVNHSNGDTYLMTFVPSQFDYSSHAKTLDRTLGALRNPYVLPTLKTDFRPDRSMIVTFRNFSKRGSLKDYMRHVRKPATPHYDKYAHTDLPMDPVDEDRAAKIGRQILEGLLYLRAVGCPYGHLSAHNVIIERGVCRITDYDNAFANTTPAMARFTARYRDREERDVVAFAHILYELCAGFELEESKPDYYPEHFPASIRKVVKAILAPKRDLRPMLEDLVELPVFANVRLNEPNDDETRISRSMRALLQHAMRREQPPPKLRIPAGVTHVEDDAADVHYDSLEYVSARKSKVSAVTKVTSDSMARLGRTEPLPKKAKSKSKSKSKSKASTSLMDEPVPSSGSGLTDSPARGSGLTDAPTANPPPPPPPPPAANPPPPPPPPPAANPPPPPPPPP